jgi:hypothetical protein
MRKAYLLARICTLAYLVARRSCLRRASSRPLRPAALLLESRERGLFFSPDGQGVARTWRGPDSRLEVPA